MGSSRISRAASAALAISMTAGIVVGTASAGFAAGVQRVSVATGDTGNGKIDHIAVTFNVPMKKTLTPQVSSGPGQPGFSVDGYVISGFSWASDTALNVLLAEKSTYDTDARPQVRYVSGGGGAESLLGIEADSFDVTATDGAGPALVGLRVDDQGAAKLFNFSAITNGRKGDLATLVFSEPASLAGTTNWARWLNLEKAIKFNNEGACGADGQGDNITFNFPQPRADQTAMATIVTPPIGESAREFVVSFVQNAIAPPGSAQFPGVPQGCYLGIETAAFNQAIITDAANNAATRQNAAGSVKVYPTPVEASLLHAYTKDGLVGTANGLIDGVEFTFDQFLTTQSIADHLGSVEVVLGAQRATIDVANVTHPVIGGITYTNVVRAPLILPAGATWDTGDRPRVRYTKPSACTPSAGTTGLKAQLSTPGFFSCVSSFDVQTYDGARPVARDAVTTDGNLNGRVDSVTITFSEALKQGTAAGWSLDGQAATGFTLSENKRSATIPFAEGTSGNTGAGGATVAYTPQTTPSFRTTDTWDLELPATTLVATDGAAPRITDVSVADTDGNGSIDTATLTYSEAIVDPGAGKASKFQVGGVAASAFGEGTANDDTLTLLVNVPGTDAKSVSFAGASIADALGNSAGDQFIDASLVDDLAAPVGSVQVSPSAPIGVGTSTVTVTYTEALATAPTVTLGSKTVTGALDAEDASIWEGTVDVAEGDCATPTGCAVSVSAVNGEDTAGNVQGLASLQTEIDTIAPAVPTLGGFTAGQASGPAAPANTINSLTRTLAIAAGIVAGDAAGGHAELTVDGSVLDGSQTGPIGASATSVSPARSFADLAALQAVLLDGTYQLGVRVCDDAGNCADSAAHSVLVDTAGVAVSLLAPNDGQVVSGGDVLTIAWDADETALDLDHVELDLVIGGTLTTIDHAQGADGTYDWTVPAIDAAAARIRATAVDAAGNRTVVSSTEAFAIDSTAPVVGNVKAGSVSPFVGGTATVTWTVTDATVNRVAEPIAIEYSTDGGATWLPINGGAYSKANDGSEVWNVPAGPSFSLALRVTATDATAATGSATIERIARGVAGYVADGTGKVVAFGTADPTTNESKVKNGSWNKAMALNPAGTKGVTVSGRGTIFPFSIGDASVPRKPGALRLPADSVRDVALIGSTKGYVLDEHGELHAFGGAKPARVAKIWRGDMARAIVLNSERDGGWVLSAKGHVQPFAIGNADMPSYKNGSKFRGAVDLVMNEAGTGGWILRSNGAVIAVGKGVSRPDSPDKAAGADARALVMVTDSAGYWIGPDGTFHAVGDAFGDPSTKSLKGAVSAA